MERGQENPGGQIEAGAGGEDDGRGMRTEVEAEQAMKSERLLKNYKRWKTLIISVIVFVMLFILAFLLTMFICKGDC